MGGSGDHIGSSGKKVMLHGVLKLWIDELDLKGLHGMWADIYDGDRGCHATVELPPVKVTRSTGKEVENSKVVWQERLRVFVAHEVSEVVFTLTSGSYQLGKARVSASELLQHRHLDDWFPVHGKLQLKGQIRVVLDFFPASEDPLWGVGLPHEFQGVPFTYFPQHEGCHVVPYQNSHIHDDYRPPISLPRGRQYKPGSYWQELYQAVRDAKEFIYIAGWSLFGKIHLRRSASGGLDQPLGDLLIEKANEGVRVLIMVWDDKTNNLDLLMSKEGMMHTHDEEGYEQFKSTEVKFFKCPRDPSDSTFKLAQGFVFTHHQKAVVLDAPAVSPYPASIRRLVAFVGGIDLCGGRYDTPEHCLFKTLNTVHSDDFHQESLPGANKAQGGPRQPWHDIHSRLEGPVAWDVHNNFTQRWLCQGGESRASLLVDVSNANVFCPPAPVQRDPSSTWNVQLFRSIDSSSVNFPQDPESVYAKGFVRESVHVVDRSIQDAYICAIRRAKRFIFIENQYFMGSSYAWNDNNGWEDTIPHVIPLELGLKIASKIRADEEFRVYIIIPMAPNGNPPSKSVQDLLHHQRKTMEMMYTIIRKALEDKARFSEAPTDFLSFFCLGKKEAHSNGEYVPLKSPPPNSNYALAQENRRFPIYVHAKLMIVDDEYVIIGSANINQRAMDGGRDSEMAMGAFQPSHVMKTSSGAQPFGDIYAFRMSLWFEHLGEIRTSFQQPWTVECMTSVHEISSANMLEYMRPGAPASDVKGHLLNYPVNVTGDGRHIYTKPGFQNFPDTQGTILGAQDPSLPGLLTA